MPASGPGVSTPRFRAAGPGDTLAIAGLHADSWQRHYRGLYSDAFLDDEVNEYLLATWTERLSAPPPEARTLVAELDGALVGFAHVLLGKSPSWGALLDNLHVSYGVKGQGTGTRLLARAARAVFDAVPGSGLYLWVYERNSAARAFYDARGGSCVERTVESPPGGDSTRLLGELVVLRYAWPDTLKLASRA